MTLEIGSELTCSMGVTDMTASIPFVNRQVARRVNSLQQGGQPGDVAQAISFLVSDRALGINGEVLRLPCVSFWPPTPGSPRSTASSAH